MMAVAMQSSQDVPVASLKMLDTTGTRQYLSDINKIAEEKAKRKQMSIYGRQRMAYYNWKDIR